MYLVIAKLAQNLLIKK